MGAGFAAGVFFSGKEFALPCLSRTLGPRKSAPDALQTMGLRYRLHNFVMHCLSVGLEAAYGLPRRFLVALHSMAGGRRMIRPYHRKQRPRLHLYTFEWVVSAAAPWVRFQLPPPTGNSAPGCTYTRLNGW